MAIQCQSSSGDTTGWLALQVRARHEKLTSAVLRLKGYESFLPLYRAERRWSDRTKRIDLPLFPGYVFCWFDVHLSLPILTTPGVIQIVGGRTPIPIDNAEIAAIQKIVKSGLTVEPWSFVQSGKTVSIVAGPFQGIEGVLLSSNNTQRLVVSITLLQRAVAVEIDSRCVVAVAPAQPFPTRVATTNSAYSFP